MFFQTDVARLRYLTTAFKFRARAQVGYAKIADPDAQFIVSKYSIPSEVDTLLLFQENTHEPLVRASIKELAIATLFEILEAHQFLQLPRLSSQEIFDQVSAVEEISKDQQKILITSLASHFSSVLPSLQEVERDCASFCSAHNMAKTKK